MDYLEEVLGDVIYGDFNCDNPENLRLANNARWQYNELKQRIAKLEDALREVMSSMACSDYIYNIAERALEE